MSAREPMGRESVVEWGRRGHDVRRFRSPESWVDAIVPGDVLDWNGRPRKVRAVRRYPNDRLHSIELLKVARSAYPSPTTVRYRSEILAASKGIIGHVSLCTTPLECAVQRTIDANVHHGWTAPIKQDQTVGVLR